MHTQQAPLTFAKLADLPLEVESCDLRGLSQDVSSGFVRVTTVVRLHGQGHVGLGEDIVYDPNEQGAFQRGGAPDLAGSWTLETFGAHVDGLELLCSAPIYEAFRDWRRWAFHSAALDLALRQAGCPLHEALGLDPRPVRFVVSRRLGEPASCEGVRELVRRYPGVRLKLDATESWDERVLRELAELGAVETVDFKGYSPDGDVAYPGDPALYRRVVEALPHVWLEDPHLDVPGAREALAGHGERVTWDMTVRSLADIQALAPAPAMINVKPSRFGSLKELCATYDHCAAHGIGVYGGGQFELGPGRGHVQYLASLFHADAPNDVAPAGYNETDVAGGLPASPLPPSPATHGFRWSA